MPVRTEVDVPDAFSGQFALSDSVLSAFKVPRDIERRNTRAGEDLYDLLVVLYQDRIEAIHRSADVRKGGSAKYSEVLAITKSIYLLSGELTLTLPEKDLVIPFNSVSEDLIDATIARLEGLCVGQTGLDPAAPNPGPRAMSFLYANILYEEQKAGDYALISHQPELKTEKTDKGFWDWLIGVFFKRTLRESMILGTTDRICVYSHVPPTVTFPLGAHGIARTTIARGSISDVTAAASHDLRDVWILTFDIGSRKLSYLVGQEGIPVSLVSGL